MSCAKFQEGAHVRAISTSWRGLEGYVESVDDPRAPGYYIVSFRNRYQHAPYGRFYVIMGDETLERVE
jgi:hypothetical protein